MIQKTGVERRIVRDQHRIINEFQPLWRDLGKQRRCLDHVVGDAGQRDYKTRNRQFGIDERHKLIDDLPASNAIGAEFDNSVRRSLRARRLDINDNEVEFVQGARLGVVAEQLDGVALEHFEPAIIAHEIGDQQAGQFGIDVRYLENAIDDLAGFGSAATVAQEIDCFLDKGRV